MMRGKVRAVFRPDFLSKSETTYVVSSSAGYVMFRLFSALLNITLSGKCACAAYFPFSRQSSNSASCLRIAPVAALIS